MASSSDAAASSSSTSIPTLPDDFPFIPIGHPDTMMSMESVRRAVQEFQTRPTDIMVATFPKTGTTLVTWICHQLRTGGHTDFECIYDVIPWPTLCWDIGQDANIQGNEFTPRVFKSHLRMASIYRGCKYIVTVRDPLKTAISFYNFFVHAKQVPNFINMNLREFTMETPFVKGRKGRASIWEYYQEYHQLLHCPSVLVLVYEDLVKDMKTSVQMIAKFMDLDIYTDEDLISKVVSMCTKDYMAQHQSKFDEPYERAKQLGRSGDVAQLAPGAKVAVQQHQQVMDEIGIQFLQEEWTKTMAPIGYDDYKSFASTIRQINQERYKL